MSLRCRCLAVVLLCACIAPARAADGGNAALRAELDRQASIYRGKAAEYTEGYVTDRTLEDYASALGAGFNRALAKLGPSDRWLDIGAGSGQAVLDYYSAAYDWTHPLAAKPAEKKAHGVAMSIEDRRTPSWGRTAARLTHGQIRYLHGRSLRDYSPQELGRYQLVTDVVGGFSYTANLSLFMESVLALLDVGGTFYAVLQDVDADDGASRPYYAGSPFLTQIRDAKGSEVKVCRWLRTISCVQVACESRRAWKPPLEVYSIRKRCDATAVPPLETVRFEAGTPPERIFRLTARRPQRSGSE
jgi:hypothetical protein